MSHVAGEAGRRSAPGHSLDFALRLWEALLDGAMISKGSETVEIVVRRDVANIQPVPTPDTGKDKLGLLGWLSNKLQRLSGFDIWNIETRLDLLLKEFTEAVRSEGGLPH